MVYIIIIMFTISSYQNILYISCINVYIYIYVYQRLLKHLPVGPNRTPKSEKIKRNFHAPNGLLARLFFARFQPQPTIYQYLRQWMIMLCMKVTRLRCRPSPWWPLRDPELLCQSPHQKIQDHPGFRIQSKFTTHYILTDYKQMMQRFKTEATNIYLRIAKDWRCRPYIVSPC